MRVEVETDLKLPEPPPLPSMPPMEEEKEAKSTEKHIVGKGGRIKSTGILSLLPKSGDENIKVGLLVWVAVTVLPPAEGKEKKRLGPT